MEPLIEYYNSDQFRIDREEDLKAREAYYKELGDKAFAKLEENDPGFTERLMEHYSKSHGN